MANWYKPHYKIIHRLQDKTFVSRLGRYRFFSDRRVRRFLRWKKGGIGRHLRGFSLMKWYKQRYFFGLKFFNFSTKKRRKVRFFHHKNMYKVGLDRKKGFLSFFRKFDDSKIKKWFREFYNNSNSFKVLNFLRIFETRLDVLCFRLKLMPTIFLANSYIKSKGITINNNQIFSPSYLLQLGDLIHFAKASVWRFFSNKFLKQLWKRWHRFHDLNIVRKKTKYLFYREFLNKNKRLFNEKSKVNIQKYSNFFDKSWSIDLPEKKQEFKRVNKKKYINNSLHIYMFNLFYLKNLKFKVLNKYFNILNNITLLQTPRITSFLYYLFFFLKTNYKITLGNSLKKINLFYTNLYSSKNKLKVFLLPRVLKMFKVKKPLAEKNILLDKWVYTYNAKPSITSSLRTFEYLTKLKKDQSNFWNIGTFFSFLKIFKKFLETLFLNFFFQKNSFRFLLLKIWNKVNKFYVKYSSFFNQLLHLLKLNYTLNTLMSFKGISNTSGCRHLIYKFFEIRFNFFNKCNYLLSHFNENIFSFISLIKTFLLPFSFYRASNKIKQSNYLYSIYFSSFEKYFKPEKLLAILDQHEFIDRDLFVKIFIKYCHKFFKNSFAFRILSCNLKKKEIFNILNSILDAVNFYIDDIRVTSLKKICWMLQTFSYNYAFSLLSENLNIEYFLLNKVSFIKKDILNLNSFIMKEGLNDINNKSGTITNLTYFVKKPLNKKSVIICNNTYDSVFKKNLYQSFLIFTKKKLVKKNLIKFLGRKKLFNKAHFLPATVPTKQFLNKNLGVYWPILKKNKKNILSKWLVTLPYSMYSFMLQKRYSNLSYKRKKIPTRRFYVRLKQRKSRRLFKKYSFYRRSSYSNRLKILLMNRKKPFSFYRFYKKSIVTSSRLVNLFRKLKFVGVKKNWKTKKQNKLFNSYFSHLCAFDNKPLRTYDKWEKFRYLRWKLFATKYYIRSLKKKYRFVRGLRHRTFFENLNAKKFLIYWFIKRYKKFIPFFFSHFIENSNNLPLFKKSSLRSYKKFHFLKKKNRKMKLFFKSSILRPKNFLFNKFKFIWRKRKRLKKRKRLRYSYNRFSMKKKYGQSRIRRKLKSYRKYMKLKKNILSKFIDLKYQFNNNSLLLQQPLKSLKNSVYFYLNLNNIKRKLKLNFYSRRLVILQNELFLFENLINSRFSNQSSKLKLVKHITKRVDIANTTLLRNKIIYNLLVKHKYDKQLKYNVKERKQFKKWWEKGKTKKILLRSKFLKKKRLFYGSFLKRHSLKRYKKFFYYRHRWHRSSLLVKSYQWRSKLLSLDKIKKFRKIKFTNIRVKPLLILPSCIEFDFISFRALMISFPNLEASLTGGANSNYFYSLVNFYQRLGL